MVSWALELVQAAMYDKQELGQIIGAHVPDGFPNEPVRKYVLPAKLKHLEQDSTYGKWSGMIVHVSDGVVIGSMGFKSAPDQYGHVEIGYDIIPSYQGRGYATEMAQALIRWAFEETSVTRVTAECLTSNKASIRVLEKVGMRQLTHSDEMLNWELYKP
jgi:[ribosomal protein S5]-alanine N-acetyltransferase